MTTMSILSEGITKIYKDDIWKLHGVPRKIRSNQGLQFALKFMKKFMRALEMTKQLSMVYHPQTDG